MDGFRVGIDGYGLKPLGLEPLALLEWAKRNGAEGVQFSEGAPETDDSGYAKTVSRFAAENGLYLEWGGGQHIPFDVRTGRPIDIASINRKAAERASALGARTVRSCSGGLMRWAKNDPPIEVYLREMAAGLRAQRPFLRDFGVSLAIETHFEFTTFELLRLFEMCAAEPGDFLGICLDTMNLLTMLEDPAAATRRVLPWVVSTHIKDGGIVEIDEGFRTFTAPAGAGIVDFPAVFEALLGLDRDVPLTIEDHGGEFFIPLAETEFRAKFPDLAGDELASLRALAKKTHGRMENEGLAPLDRGLWPGACEARIRNDLRAVRETAERVARRTSQP